MALKAFIPVQMPSQSIVSIADRQKVETNERRLNDNFQKTTDMLAELYERVRALEAAVAELGGD